VSFGLEGVTDSLQRIMTFHNSADLAEKNKQCKDLVAAEQEQKFLFNTARDFACVCVSKVCCLT
jgi:hypothetical protein